MWHWMKRLSNLATLGIELMPRSSLRLSMLLLSHSVRPLVFRIVSCKKPYIHEFQLCFSVERILQTSSKGIFSLSQPW